MRAVAALLVAAPLVVSARFAMPWLCLERCGANSSQVAHNIKQVLDNAGTTFTAVSFERFNLGPDSTLVLNNLTDPTESFVSAGLETFPMVSSYPYPPQFIDWMRQVFRNPMPFVRALQSHIQARGYSGVNIDWEPTKGVTARDALDYAAFLDLLASELHAVGAQVTVDFATWSPIWNLTALAATGVDRFMDMGTYTDSPDSWKRQLQVALQALPHDKIVVGLETTMASSGAPYPVSVLQQRFQLLREAGLDAVGLWVAPIPATFLPFLRNL